MISYNFESPILKKVINNCNEFLSQYEHLLDKFGYDRYEDNIMHKYISHLTDEEKELCKEEISKIEDEDMKKKLLIMCNTMIESIDKEEDLFTPYFEGENDIHLLCSDIIKKFNNDYDSAGLVTNGLRSDENMVYLDCETQIFCIKFIIDEKYIIGMYVYFKDYDDVKGYNEEYRFGSLIRYDYGENKWLMDTRELNQTLLKEVISRIKNDIELLWVKMLETYDIIIVSREDEEEDEEEESDDEDGFIHKLVDPELKSGGDILPVGGSDFFVKDGEFDMHCDFKDMDPWLARKIENRNKK